MLLECTNLEIRNESQMESTDLDVITLYLVIKERECRLEREENIKLNPVENQHLKEKRSEEED